MVKEIIVDVGINETRIGILEDKNLSEIYIETPSNERLVGNIYVGKVCSVLPGMQAAFVDIGYEKNAFLYVGDAISQSLFHEDGDIVHENGKQFKNIDEILSPGQEITVQVIKEPVGTKGPRVTTHLTLPGRHFVLLPNADYIGISRRIGNEKERESLRDIASSIKPKGMGLIVRTASEGKTFDDFNNDIKFLLSLWEKIKNRKIKGAVPRCIHKDLNLVYRAVRDMFTWDVDKFIINDRNEYLKVLDLADMIMPALKSRVEHFTGRYDLFEYYGIEESINSALSKKVWLKCGGYLIIDHTEALTVIDVNTGKFVGTKNLEETVLKTNIDAAKEIAKQLRLRDIGGIIVIDFIDMHERENQQTVIDVLKQSLKNDRTKTSVLGMTGLGLIEMTRKKVRQELSSILCTDCPKCHGTGKILSPDTIARSIEKEIEKFFAHNIASEIEVELNGFIADYFIGNYNKMLDEIQKKHTKIVHIKSSNVFKYDEIKIKEIDRNSYVC